MTRATGLRRATEAHIGSAINYRLAQPGLLPELQATGLTTTVVQPIARILDQGSLPACVGCTAAGRAEALIDSPEDVAVRGYPRFSWVRLWTDARRRDGELHEPALGTWFSSAIESMVKRGLDPEESGEEDRLEEMTQPDDLDSELAAFDERQTSAEHWRLSTGDLDALDDALARGLAVGLGIGVRDAYFSYFGAARSPSEVDQILGTSYLGGDTNGHEQGVFAVRRVKGARVYGLQNSWGLTGGCHLPDGTWQLGCCWVDEMVMRSAWDVDAIRVTRRNP
jgi:hypothetical protein